MNVKKMSKSQVLAYVRKHGEWDGYLMPCKMYSFDHFGYRVTLVNVPGGWVGVKGNENYTFDDMYHAWAYYNATNKTGLYAHYYMIVK